MASTNSDLIFIFTYKMNPQKLREITLVVYLRITVSNS